MTASILVLVRGMKKKPIMLKQQGFTLVETIVTVAIVGILAAAIVSAVLGQNKAFAAGSNNSGNSPKANINAFSQSDNISNNFDEIVDNSSQIDGNLEIRADHSARLMELQIIQTAMDTMMINKEIQTVKETSFTTNMKEFPTGNPLYPKYIRRSTTVYRYSCDNDGEVFQYGE